LNIFIAGRRRGSISFLACVFSLFDFFWIGIRTFGRAELGISDLEASELQRLSASAFRCFFDIVEIPVYFLIEAQILRIRFLYILEKLQIVMRKSPPVESREVEDGWVWGDHDIKYNVNCLI
jgi:hypothetical protein